MKGPLLSSIGLHLLFGLLLVWANRAAEENKRPLPQATVVKLIRPAALPSAPVTKPTEEFKVPETEPPLAIPKPKPEKTVDEKEPLKKPEPEKPKSSAPVPKELVGDGVTLKLSNPGFEYDFYLGLVQSKIERNFRPPPGRKSAMALVGFTILKSGEITRIALAQSSGNLLVDQAAERAVRAAGRFPPLPAQYTSGELSINIEFVANPRAGR